MRKPLTMTREQEGRIRDIAEDMGMEYGDEIRDLLAEIDALRGVVPRTDPRPLAGGRISLREWHGYISLGPVGGDIQYAFGDERTELGVMSPASFLAQGEQRTLWIGDHTEMVWQGSTPDTRLVYGP